MRHTRVAARARARAVRVTLAAALSIAAPAWADTDTERAQAEEIAELKRQLAVVVGEVQQLKANAAVPESEELKSAYGLGPAASKVYGIPRGVSLGGYAEGAYTSQIGDAPGTGQDEANITRVVLYVGNKFSDRLTFNTEIEFEDGFIENEGEETPGEVAVEFAQLDYLMRPELNFRGGLLLVPVGFLNEVHEPPFFFGTERPEVERQIIPSTWRENGLGIFGSVGETMSYRAYVMNGLNASGFNSEGLRDARQSGAEAIANDVAFVGRLDFEPLAGLGVGASYFQGDSGQDQPGFPRARTQLWELHAQYRNGPLHLRTLYTQAGIGDSAELSALNGSTVAKRMVGGYAEIAYDVMSWIRPGSETSLSPFFRFEYLDTQSDVPGGFDRDRTQPRRLFIPGIQFKPTANVVLKLDYRNIDPFEGNQADELRFGFGVSF